MYEKCDFCGGDNQNAFDVQGIGIVEIRVGGRTMSNNDMSACKKCLTKLRAVQANIINGRMPAPAEAQEKG
jgi:hypothetical protein